jgi:CRP-like cAMP-binding protein
MSEDKLFDRVGRVCDSGEILFRDGDPGDTMYVLRSGRVRVFIESNGREKTLAFIEAGDFFGEMALLNNKPRTASAECVEETRLLVIDAKMFEAMLRGNAEIAVRMIQRLAKRLDQANGLVGVLMQKDPKARVILGLEQAAERGVVLEDGSVSVAADEESLAQQVGVSAEDVHGVLQRMARLGIIEVEDGGFRIPNVLRLHEFLEFLQSRNKG